VSVVRIEPRQQMLDIWRAVARFSRKEDGWRWEGREPANSVSSAEQLLCLLYPAAELPAFQLDVPDGTTEDVLKALEDLGDSVEIPKLIIDLLAEYMDTYSAPDGTPLFSGGTYFLPLEEEMTLSDKQRELDVVASYSMSVSLSLAALGFLRVFDKSVRRPALKAKIKELEAATSIRLSAAMVGLLRSFTVSTFEPDSAQGQLLRGMLSQSGRPDREVLDSLRHQLAGVRAGLRDVTLGLSQGDDLDNENLLFECGWTWGVARDATKVETTEPIGRPREGAALPAPYLYFTVTALDSIVDLFSERTRMLGLLNAEQQRLALALQLRWDLTLGYWSAIARFDNARWPLEDIPWRTTDSVESEYLSLLVTAIVILDLLGRRATDDDLTRTVAVLEELAIRGRISRRMTKNDPALELHVPGLRLELDGAQDLGPAMVWTVADFAALMLRRAVRAAGLSRDSGARDRLLAVAEDALGHLWKRRLREGPAAGLWDDFSPFSADVEVDRERPSWYLTERVIEGLVVASAAVTAQPIRSADLIDITRQLLAEAEHLFSQEQFEANANDRSTMYLSLEAIQTRLQRARAILYDRPGTANSIVGDVLLELDTLTVARNAARTI
jgi:hypothetical protein